MHGILSSDKWGSSLVFLGKRLSRGRGFLANSATWRTGATERLEHRGDLKALFEDLWAYIVNKTKRRYRWTTIISDISQQMLIATIT